MTSDLLRKHLAINGVIIAIVIAIIWISIDYLAADYLTALMEKHGLSPSDTHRMFVEATHRTLILASVVALIIAFVMSFILTQRVLKPLSEVVLASRTIAVGNYSTRLPIRTNDEVGKLAEAFNQMAIALERVEQLRKSMVVDIGHELRTPLTTIRGYLEALEDGLVEPTKPTFELLHQEISRLNRLVNDFHKLTRAEAAKEHLERKQVSLHELVRRAIELYNLQLKDRDIDLGCRLSDDADRVTADPDHLLQVISNLFDNVWQHTPSGGEASVSTSSCQDGIKLTIENCSNACAKQDLPFIFERFYRADKSRTRGDSGSGVGLAIVKELVEAHKGQVGADLTGERFRIWFTLPA